MTAKRPGPVARIAAWAACAIVGLSLAGALPGCSDSGGESGGYRAKIVRTTYGIPHITADDWGSLGYGYGYAYAQDNFCVFMKAVVTANGESARYFGADGNLASDFVYRYYNTNEYIRDQFLAVIPQYGRDLIAGFAAGLNRYLDETGVDHLAEGSEGCRGAAWVRHVSPTDLGKVYRRLGLYASTDRLAPLIIAATAPTTSSADARGVIPGAGRLASAAPLQSTPFDFDALGLPKPSELGSNAYGLGAKASQSGRGIVLGNPHFPWHGEQRFYEVHLTVPGTYDVMGASLQGVPIVNIGFNKDLAWSHTVSTARRFTFFELELKPGDPMTYIVDGQERPIRPVPISAEIKMPDGSLQTRTETIYETDFGPVVDLGAINGLLAGWPTAAGTLLTVRDANLHNTRLLEQWVKIGESHSIADLREALKTLGIPWVNTIAADRAGNAYYADIGTVPYVTKDMLDACKGKLAGLLTSQGFPALDASKSECDWKTAPGGPEGIMPPDMQPELETDTYVANSNDSYWLSNPDHLLTGYSPIIGAEDVPQSIRTRQGFVQIEDRLAGTDGLVAPGFTVKNLQQVMFGERSLGGELTVDAFVQICRGVDDWTPYSTNPAVAATACDVLAGWDRHNNEGSVGAHVFREVWDRMARPASFWKVPFDATDPVHTPNTVNVDDGATVEAVRAAIGAAVDRWVAAGVPLDRPYGEVQYRKDGADKIPIHGGPSSTSFSVIHSPIIDGEGYSDISTGNSYMQTVTWTDSECPDAYAVLSYSQSTDPASPHYADQTRLYSQKGWNPMPFCPKDIAMVKTSELLLEQ